MAESEDGQEKSEEPSERKLNKAKEEGNVARSRELGTAVLLIASVAVIFALGGWLVEAMVMITNHTFEFDRAYIEDTSRMSAELRLSVYEASLKTAPILLLMMIAGIIGSAGMGGVSFSTKAIAPKLNRLSPLQGLKRMFSLNSLVELGKSWLKVLLIGGTGVALLWYYQRHFNALGSSDVMAEMKGAIELLLLPLFILALVTALIAVIDVPWQAFSHKKKLRMTMQEVKDEYKNTEGKPEVKGRIRQLQREMSQRRMMDAVPEADVVITNPEHFSVALKYDQGRMDAPVVVAKGGDEIALKIREIAKAHEVPIVQAPPLARSLFQYAKIDQPIPEGLFVAVAQVLAYVWQLRQHRKQQGDRPNKPNKFDIPDDLRFDP